MAGTYQETGQLVQHHPYGRSGKLDHFVQTHFLQQIQGGQQIDFIENERVGQAVSFLQTI
jgi:hypothetical protein